MTSDMRDAMKKYSDAKLHRAEVISANRSRRIKGLPLLKVPELPAKPLAWQLSTKEDGYISTVVAFTKEDAIKLLKDELEDAGIVWPTKYKLTSTEPRFSESSTRLVNEVERFLETTTSASVGGFRSSPLLMIGSRHAERQRKRRKKV